MKEQIDGTCMSYQETNCICNIAAPKLIWKEMKVLRDKKNIFIESIRMEKEFAEQECRRLQSELDRTKKQLEIAVDALKEITNNDYDADWQNDLAQATLEKIKDIK